MKKLVIATHNKGKAREIEKMLSGYEVVLVGELTNEKEPEETGKTFEENALIKARAAYAATKLPSFGDDSGLCVDALNGEPGVYSARFAETPKACNEKLLRVMKDVPEEKRTARFVSVIAYVDGEREFTVEGRCEGKILYEEVGKEGFGYDPLFFSEELGKSFGEADIDEKNRVSHRGKALKEFVKELEKGE